MGRVQPRLASHCKLKAAHALTVHKGGPRAKWSSHSWFPSLHSPFTLSLQLSVPPVFSGSVVKLRPDRCEFLKEEGGIGAD